MRINHVDTFLEVLNLQLTGDSVKGVFCFEDEQSDWPHCK